MNCASDDPPLLLSREEKAVLALLAAASAVAIAALGLTIMWLYRELPRPGQPIDFDRLIPALAAFSAVFFGSVYAIFGRWPGSVTTRASMDVGASADEIWDAVVLRDDYPGWKKIYTGITRLNEPGEVYRVDYAENSECPACSLPRDPDRPRWSSRIEILESHRPYFYSQAVFPKVASGNTEDTALDAEHFGMGLQPLDGGGTRVTFMSTAYRPAVWFAFLCLLGRPMKEGLRSLKAHLDGTPDETMYGIAARRMDAARKAPRRCTCSEAASPRP